ncbi:hypothetical protein HJB56_05185 [Rhizobium lentis]|uniref:hypothetical protein n=1 Tax=Rhizobium lentis TaxID=1138194 RepID=UPI001C83FD90|nr:hypothetical protein [Rhizobium lentis]MBX5082179.1 hypothetical protein [Rhizobium lentis]MBX5094889.1 hypothetical protein [Rhizobium lentis]MBX5119614.1 hypothetical protein [Rhizobium lentis]
MFGLLDALKMGAGVAAGLMFYHLYAVAVGYPSAAREARADYVLLAEKTAAEAKAAEMERQRNAAAQSLTEFQKRAAADDIADRQRQATLEQDLRANELLLSEKNRSCAADAGDVDFILRH